MYETPASGANASCSHAPWRRAWGLVLVAGLTATCGGGSSPSSPSTGGGSSNTLVFSVTSAGVSPRTMIVPNGSRVVFLNSDSRPHNMTSDPHPTHEDCPELNQIGFLNPGQQRESGNLVVSRVCGFHDHDNPGSLTLQGSITIQ
jgi:plastocyanin